MKEYPNCHSVVAVLIFDIKAKRFFCHLCSGEPPKPEGPERGYEIKPKGRNDEEP
jgi:hypothetical protein